MWEKILMSLSNCPTSQSLLFYVQYFSVILKPATLPIYTWHQFFFNLRIELNLNNNIFYKKWFCQWKKIKLTFRNNTALICVKSLFRTGLTEVVVYVWEPCLGNSKHDKSGHCSVSWHIVFMCVNVNCTVHYSNGSRCHARNDSSRLQSHPLPKNMKPVTSQKTRGSWETTTETKSPLGS